MFNLFVCIWNFGLGTLTTWIFIDLEPARTMSANDLVSKFVDSALAVIGGVTTAIILTLLKKWAIRKHNKYRKPRKFKRY